jgi:putative toxin-antitoxin system antitoxin component (TIGR02293 family)
MSTKPYDTENIAISVVNEAMVSFAHQIDFEVSNYKEFLQDKMLIIKAIRKGIPYTLFKKLREISAFSEQEWADFLNISTKSLQRYKAEPGFVFKPIHSEKIIELAEVTHHGNEVFDTPAQFGDWLKTPSMALNDMTPFELLRDSYGKDLVMEELTKIDQGIFS